MGNTNFGNQIVGLTFGSAATALIANFVEHGIIPTGIYQGGLLSQLSPTQISVAPLVCFIDDDSNSVGIRVETTTSITLTVSSANPFIVLRFAWLNSNVNYMDVLAVSSASILAGDLVIGRCIYASGNLQSIFDYTKRTNGWVVLLSEKENELLVTPTDPVSNTLNVAAGSYLSGKGFVTIGTGISPSFPNTTLGRIDALYLDSNGVLNILQGVDSNTPIAPDFQGQVVIAQINRGANRTNVRGDEVTPIKARQYAIDQNTSIDYTYLNLGTGTDQIQASTFSILDSLNSIIASNVEDALTEIAKATVKTFTIDANEPNTINAGKVMTLFNDKARLYQETPIMESTSLVYTSTGTALNEGSQDTLSPGVVIYAFYNIASPNSAVKVVVITSAGPGTVYEIENFTFSPYRLGIDKIAIRAINSTTAILTYAGGNAGANTGRAVILTITGTVITWTPANIISFNTGGTTEINMRLVDSTHALVVYIDGSVNKTTSLILTISGGTISAGTKYQPDSTQRVLYKLKFLFKSNTTTKYIYMIMWDDGINFYTEQVSVDPASSYAIAWNGQDTTGISYLINKDQATLFSFRKGTAYYPYGQTAGYGIYPIKIAYAEGSFTSRSNIFNSATSVVFRGMSGLEISPNTHLLFGADSSNGDKGTLMLYRWKNGIPYTSKPIVIINNAISYFTKLGFLDESHILCIWMETTSTLLKCAIMEVTNNFDTIIGVSLDSGKIAGQTCRIAIDGIVQGLSGLTSSTEYLLKTDGSLTNDISDSLLVEPFKVIGKAVSATQLQLYGSNYS